MLRHLLVSHPHSIATFGAAFTAFRTHPFDFLHVIKEGYVTYCKLSLARTCSCIDVHARAEIGRDSEAQMQLLFAELKRIEGQQQQLKSAVAQNRVLVVHPPKGFHGESVDDEYAEEKEVKPDPDRFIPSGGTPS